MINYNELAEQVKVWGRELGFQEVAITDVDLAQHEKYLQAWLENDFHGDMSYMSAHGNKRSRPELLLPGTVRIISVRLDYLAADTKAVKVLQLPDKAYISRYALGRDYHKLIRKRLATLANKITEASEQDGHRAFVDSAPVLEKALAAKSGIGWIGKHTVVINKKAGSWFFLGEIYTTIPLPIDKPASNHCGSCSACIDVCPTQAIVGPYQLDARKCISYLTIESKSSIPVEFRSAIGNRVFGCDDCQLVCPWNKFASHTKESDFSPRHQLDNADLLTLFLWTEAQFLKNTEGSAIRRTGYEGWLRNLAVGLGNANHSTGIIDALNARLADTSCSELLEEHYLWALKEQLSKNKASKL